MVVEAARFLGKLAHKYIIGEQKPKVTDVKPAAILIYSNTPPPEAGQPAQTDSADNPQGAIQLDSPQTQTDTDNV